MRKLALLLTLLLLSALPAMGEATPPTAAEIAAQFLPDYVCLDGRADGEYAFFLMTNPAGETVFVGGVSTADGWVFTESTPLPEGTALLTEHAGEGGIQLKLPLDGGETLTAQVRLTEGTWQVTGLMCPTLWLDFRANGILGPECAWYGDVTFDGDIARLNWAALPTDEAAVLALLDTTQWRYLAENTRALREGTETVDFYRMGTPVRLLEEPEGETVLAAVFGGDVHIRVPVAALTDAAGQIAVDEYDGIPYNPTRWGFPSIEIRPDAAIPSTMRRAASPSAPSPPASSIRSASTPTAPRRAGSTSRPSGPMWMATSAPPTCPLTSPSCRPGSSCRSMSTTPETPMTTSAPS